ncbi:MAG: MFS transporter [Victivallaceae bacterium]|nr:MFS transporter [Victivallaceae bacterium]
MKINPKLAPWLVLAGATLFYFCSNLQKVLVPGATFNELQSIFQLDAASVTRFGAAFFYTYALLQLVAGPLADRFSGAKVIAVSGSLLVAGSLGSALTVSPFVLIICRILTAAGAAMIYLSLIQHAGSFLGEKFPLVLGVIFIVGYFGLVAGTTPFIAGVHHFGYVRMMFSAGIFILLIYLLYLMIFAVVPKPCMTKKGSFSLREWGHAFSLRNFPVFFLTSIPFALTYTFMAIIGKKFLEDYAGFTPVGAGNILFAMTVISAVNGFAAAWVSRLLKDRKLPILWYSAGGTFVVQLLFVLLLGIRCRSVWIFTLLCCLAASMANIAPVFVAFLRERNEKKCLATVVGVSNAVSYFFTAATGTVCGKVLDIFPPIDSCGIKIYSRNAYLSMFAVFAAFAAVAVIFIIVLTIQCRREKK